MGNFRDDKVLAVDKNGKKRRVPESWLHIKSFGFRRPPSQRAKVTATPTTKKKTEAEAKNKAEAKDSKED